jgi:hypothetical protein
LETKKRVEGSNKCPTNTWAEEMKMTVRVSHIGGCKLGDVVTFYTKGEERSVTGYVTRLNFGEYQGDYCDVEVLVDGMTYVFGTGGHLGQSWTTEGGTEEWFKA